MRFRHSRLAIGAILTILPIASHAAAKPPSSQFVTVNGARLEYLDWGGEGPPLLFLAGLGSTAHVFTDLAPEFTSTHRCLALTRRGFGQSQQTAGGCELDNLTRDIFEFATSLGLQSVTVIGHSYGGTEAIRASELYPELFRRVILLDTSWDSIPPAAPPAETKLFAAVTHMAPTDRLKSVDAFRSYQKPFMGNVWSDAAEADMRETIVVSNDGPVRARTPPRISAAIASERAKGLWTITKIPGPALLIFAHNPWPEMLADLHVDPQTVAEITKGSAEFEAARRTQIEAFRRDSPQATIVEMDHTTHYCFIQRKERVVQEMQRFLR